ncbi:crotonase/enoyl-CoA hydratase family protein [Desulfoluna spongiiphila]|uniref:crotonase/enoyl-CoA hydratase family protein n=1 Tax=Desulfoluna spongiiphila TaxID=419481 RepID=UPI0012593AE8|nr:crotonase/enoyl-CoA hydratase family protein [Desulfoluna spongiiphila]VVS91435.1 enoyl-coa hydratase/isomerase [Desulfoluna spongiiphila]
MAVLTERKGRVLTVIIDRPEVKNAVDGPTATALADVFREFEHDDSCSVAVLCGAGDTFCAGGDLSTSMDESRRHRFEPDGDAPLGPSRMVLSKPVIAAVSGYAVAGGLELALWCDMRVVEETAVFGVFCRRFGVPLIDGGTVRLPRLIGMSHAMDLILTGRPVEAVEAKQMGLANRIVPHGTSREAAEALADQIAHFPQTCMLNDRMSAYEQWDKTFEEAMKNEFQRGMTPINSGETLQGATMFTKGVGKHGAFE